METNVTDRRFRWALVLAWAPWVPTLFGLFLAFAGIGNSKATGLAAVAGGVAEMLVYWGVAALIIAQEVAIAWLIRSLSKNNMLRNLFSLISTCASVLMLLMVAGFLWLMRSIAHLPSTH
jgi:hypothetical protein